MASSFFGPQSDRRLFINTEETTPATMWARNTVGRNVVLTGLALAGVCIGSLVVNNVVPPRVANSRQPRFLQTSSSISAEMQDVLDQHNIYRCMHGVPLLEWDADIALNAQAWADVVPPEAGHSPKPRIVNGEDLGENAGSCTSCTGVDRVRNWYSEIEYTHPTGLATSISDSSVDGESVGHYTAVVWKSTTKLGCAKARFMHHSGSERDYWVCQYGPNGNTNGQFEENVLEATTSVSECGGTSADIPGGEGEGEGEGDSECAYTAIAMTGVSNQGTGGSKLKRSSYGSISEYLEACKANCNADSTCKGFVDDFSKFSRKCKPKTGSSGVFRVLKTFYTKGAGC